MDEGEGDSVEGDRKLRCVSVYYNLCVLLPRVPAIVLKGSRRTKAQRAYGALRQGFERIAGTAVIGPADVGAQKYWAGRPIA
ncbi:hypothetical protein Tco_0732928 [Tanacetum coccineum]